MFSKISFAESTLDGLKKGRIHLIFSLYCSCQLTFAPLLFLSLTHTHTHTHIYIYTQTLFAFLVFIFLHLLKKYMQGVQSIINQNDTVKDEYAFLFEREREREREKGKSSNHFYSSLHLHLLSWFNFSCSHFHRLYLFIPLALILLSLSLSSQAFYLFTNDKITFCKLLILSSTCTVLTFCAF